MMSPPDLTDQELEEVTAVFRSFETGLREATIYPKDLHKAMKMLGLNPIDQDRIDIPNAIARNGLIYFPEFCQVVLLRFRNDNDEDFRQNMFKLLCGTDPYPEDFRAKKYRLNKHFLEKKDFQHIMRNLPVEVSEEDIEEMFTFADKDSDGKLSYKEFKLMINPPFPPEVPKPHIDELKYGPGYVATQADGDTELAKADTVTSLSKDKKKVNTALLPGVIPPSTRNQRFGHAAKQEIKVQQVTPGVTPAVTPADSMITTDAIVAPISSSIVQPSAYNN